MKGFFLRLQNTRVRAMTARAPLVALVGLLTACGSSPSPMPRKASAAAVVPRKVEQLKEEKPAEAVPPLEYAYSPVGKRDPFRSILDDIAQKAVDSASGRAECGPLCHWDLEQLRLVAVISGISNPLGMVEDPNGRGHVVRRGTFVGKRNGKITQISAGEVVVTEVFKDQMGKPHSNPVVIKLPVDKQESEQEDANLLSREIAE
jgi:type IV pilus assembly protein PilP